MTAAAIWIMAVKHVSVLQARMAMRLNSLSFPIDDPVRIERLVGDQTTELAAFDQGGDTDRVMALAGQQLEPDHVAERVAQGHDLARHSATRAAYGLALRPPFAPWPWRWTLTMVPSIIAYSMSGSPETASNMRLKTSRSTQ